MHTENAVESIALKIPKRSQFYDRSKTPYTSLNLKKEFGKSKLTVVINCSLFQVK